MTREPQALINGRFLPAAELLVPIYDAGFILGATVSEQLRTFGGKLFRLDEHLARLRRGLEITSIEVGCSKEQLAAWAEELAATNHRLLDPADDLGLSIFVTPGPYPTMAPHGAVCEPTIGMSTYPLPFHLWSARYETGDALTTSRVRQVSPESWPRELKCRSRMHYYLAERDVRGRAPGTRPLLLDERGEVNETPTANVIGVDSNGRLMTPPHEAVLPGISQQAVLDLARTAGHVCTETRMSPEATAGLSELCLSSTPFCLLAVASLDGRPIGDGRPGPVYQKLLAAWSASVGLDIAAQARRFARRGEVQG
jgi:branched-subunit amino acid aminotransferase/4-amino-4-deoxychorismate lyase